MKNKKILITGASRGLGLAISKILADDYQLILHASSPDSFKEVIPNSELLCADLSDPEQLISFCKQLKKDHGDTLYGVINNAGVTLNDSLIYQSEKYIDKMLNLNLKAPIMICKTAMKIFNTSNTGVIINMSSVVGETGNAFQAVYSATKAGLIALSKSLAQEVGALKQEHAIRILTVSPGFIETDMTEGLSQQNKDDYFKLIPAKRFGKAEDIAHTVKFLLSDNASFINGTNIHVNGGVI